MGIELTMNDDAGGSLEDRWRIAGGSLEDRWRIAEGPRVEQFRTATSSTDPATALQVVELVSNVGGSHR